VVPCTPSERYSQATQAQPAIEDLCWHSSLKSKSNGAVKWTKCMRGCLNSSVIWYATCTISYWSNLGKWTESHRSATGSAYLSASLRSFKP